MSRRRMSWRVRKRIWLEEVSNENGDGEIVTRRTTKRVMTATEKALVIAVEENDDDGKGDRKGR